RGGVVYERPIVRLLWTEHWSLAALDADVGGMFAVAGIDFRRRLRRRIGGRKIVADARGAADFDANKIARLRRRIRLFVAVEPAQVHAGIGWANLQDDFAAGLEPVVERE